MTVSSASRGSRVGEIGSPVLSSYTSRTLRSRAGFTLVEVVVALAVLSIATTVLISMLGRGVALGDHSRHRTAAANIGDSILAEIQARPNAYVWPSFEDLVSGELVEITPTGANPGTAGHQVSSPPGAKAAGNQDAFFGGFSWLAHGRRVGEDANHLELTVSLYWTEAGRGQSLALTTAYPRALIENGS